MAFYLHNYTDFILVHNDYFVAMTIYYVVILLIVFDNLKKVKDREYKKK